MSLSRLTQLGIGGQAYETEVDVSATVADYGWATNVATVAYERVPLTRLGQFGVGLSAYSEAIEAVVNATVSNYGWSTYPADVAGDEPIDATVASYGWSAEQAKICSHWEVGYSGSFNGNTFPTCAWNDFVFGARASYVLWPDQINYGWQVNRATVIFYDPVNIDATTANYGWSLYSASVSYGYDITANQAYYGWGTNPASVWLVYDIDSNEPPTYGWLTYPASAGIGSDIGANVQAWGWTTNVAEVIVPSFDIHARSTNYGWQTYPATARQTSLLPTDFEAIAEAVYQKLVDEGVIQMIVETWQRQGCDPAHSQSTPPSPGKHIEVGGMQIYIERLPDGTIRHTRMP